MTTRCLGWLDSMPSPSLARILLMLWCMFDYIRVFLIRPRCPKCGCRSMKPVKRMPPFPTGREPAQGLDSREKIGEPPNTTGICAGVIAVWIPRAWVNRVMGGSSGFPESCAPCSSECNLVDGIRLMRHCQLFSWPFRSNGRFLARTTLMQL